MFSDIDKLAFEQMEALIVPTEQTEPMVEESLAPEVVGLVEAGVTIESLPERKVETFETDVDQIPVADDTKKADDSSSTSEDDGWTTVEAEDTKAEAGHDIFSEMDETPKHKEDSLPESEGIEEGHKIRKHSSSSTSSSDEDSEWTKVEKEDLENRPVYTDEMLKENMKDESEIVVGENVDSTGSDDDLVKNLEQPVQVRNDVKQHEVVDENEERVISPMGEPEKDFKRVVSPIGEPDIDVKIEKQIVQGDADLETQPNFLEEKGKQGESVPSEALSPGIQADEVSEVKTANISPEVRFVEEPKYGEICIGKTTDDKKDDEDDDDEIKVKKKVTFAATVVDNERLSDDSDTTTESQESDSESENEGSYLVDRTKPELITDLDAEFKDKIKEIDASYKSPDMAVDQVSFPDMETPKATFEDDRFVYDKPVEFVSIEPLPEGDDRKELEILKEVKTESSSSSESSDDEITSYDVTEVSEDGKESNKVDDATVQETNVDEILAQTDKEVSFNSDVEIETDVDNIPSIRKISPSSSSESDLDKEIVTVERPSQDNESLENATIETNVDDLGPASDIKAVIQDVESKLEPEILKDGDEQLTKASLSESVVASESEPDKRLTHKDDMGAQTLPTKIEDTDIDPDLETENDGPLQERRKSSSSSSEEVERVILSDVPVDSSVAFQEDIAQEIEIGKSGEDKETKLTEDVLEYESEPGQRKFPDYDEKEKKTPSTSSSTDEIDVQSDERINEEDDTKLDTNFVQYEKEPHIRKYPVDGKERKSPSSSDEEDKPEKESVLKKRTESPEIFEEKRKSVTSSESSDENEGAPNTKQFKESEKENGMDIVEYETEPTQKSGPVEDDPNTERKSPLSSGEEDTSEDGNTENENASTKFKKPSIEEKPIEIEIKEEISEIEVVQDIKKSNDTVSFNVSEQLPKQPEEIIVPTIDVPETVSILIEKPSSDIEFTEDEIIMASRVTEIITEPKDTSTEIEPEVADCKETDRAETFLAPDKPIVHAPDADSADSAERKTEPFIIETDIDSLITKPEETGKGSVEEVGDRSSSSESENEKRKSSQSDLSDDERSDGNDKPENKVPEIIETDLDAAFEAENKPEFAVPEVIGEKHFPVVEEPLSAPVVMEPKETPFESDIGSSRPEYVTEQYHSAIPVERGPDGEGPPDKDEVYCETTLTVVRRVKVKQAYGSDKTEKQPTMIEQGLGSKSEQPKIVDISDLDVHPGKRSRSPSESLDDDHDVKRRETELVEERETVPPAKEFIYAFPPSLMDQPDQVYEEYIRIPPYVPQQGSGSDADRSGDSSDDGAGILGALMGFQHFKLCGFKGFDLTT